MKKDVFKMPKSVTIMGIKSVVVHSFINGIVPRKTPTEEQIREALEVLGQDENDVRCVYCGEKMTEWDHLESLIDNKKHTGYITEIANLVPACRTCNDSKRNLHWKEWMLGDAKQSPKSRNIPDLEERVKAIEAYEKRFKKTQINLEEMAGKELWSEYTKAYEAVISAMEKTQKITNKVKKKINFPE